MVKRFGNFQLSEQEGGAVALSLADTNKSRDECEGSLVGRIYGGKGVNYTGLKQTMTKLWCAAGSLKVVEIKNQVYQFFFSNEDERRRVLEKMPWTFDNQMLVLHPWKQDIEHDESLFKFSPMWVQVWQIPTQWFTSETVWKIGKIGKIFNQVSNVIPESGSKDGRLAKMLVEVDLSKPLLRGTHICFEGDKRWIMFKYEFLPLFCFYCGKVGHSECFCETKTNEAKNGRLKEGQYGEWLRASTVRPRFKGSTAMEPSPKPWTSGSQVVGRDSGNDLKSVPQPVVLDKVGNDDVLVERETVSVGRKTTIEIPEGGVEGREGGGELLANKENIPTVTSKLSEDRGDVSSAGGVGETSEQVRRGEWVRVLQEVDHNIVVEEGEIGGKKHKGGSWKRRCGSLCKKGLNEGVVETMLTDVKKASLGKRGFCLMDEDEVIDDVSQLGKKQKVLSDGMIICPETVEEASHNWLQIAP